MFEKKVLKTVNPYFLLKCGLKNGKKNLSLNFNSIKAKQIFNNNRTLYKFCENKLQNSFRGNRGITRAHDHEKHESETARTHCTVRGDGKTRKKPT